MNQKHHELSHYPNLDQVSMLGFRSSIFSYYTFSENKQKPEEPTNQQNSRTWHDLEAIESLALEIGDGFDRLSLLLGAPILDLVQDIDSRGILGLDPKVLFVAEHRSVHRREIDGRNGESSVHVEDDASEASFGRRIWSRKIGNG